MHILFATDGSPSSELALAQAIDLAANGRATLTILCVSQILNLAWYGPFIPGTDSVLEVPNAEDAHQILDKAIATCQEHGVTAQKRYRKGNPADVILSTAEELHVDLIVVGSHGRSGLERFMMGSVSQQVVNHASCSVLLVRSPKGVAREPVTSESQAHA